MVVVFVVIGELVVLVFVGRTVIVDGEIAVLPFEGGIYLVVVIDTVVDVGGIAVVGEDDPPLHGFIGIWAVGAFKAFFNVFINGYRLD